MVLEIPQSDNVEAQEKLPITDIIIVKNVVALWNDVIEITGKKLELVGARIEFDTKRKIGLWIKNLMRGQGLVQVDQDIHGRGDIVFGSKPNGDVVILIKVHHIILGILLCFHSIEVGHTAAQLHGKFV